MGKAKSYWEPYLETRHGVLFNDDCITLLRRMKSEVVDFVFADPPFNLGKDYKNGFHDRVEEDVYFSWCQEWIIECSRILKPGGAFFLYATPELAVHFSGFMKERLTFRHWIALTMKGTYSRGKKLYPAHYALLYFTRGAPKIFNRVRVPIPICRHCGKEIKDYGGHRDKLNPEGLNLTDFWEDTSPNRHRKFKVRPGVNELKLMIPERAILISTDPGDLVLDPFGGGGTTFQAARETEEIGSALNYTTAVILRKGWKKISLFLCDVNHPSISWSCLPIMKITKIKFYDGAKDKVSRLGLADLFLELLEIIFDTEIKLLEEKNANGAAVLREALDSGFGSRGEWNKQTTGGVDWIKRIKYNKTIVAKIGVEVQVSARSDLLIRDVVHLRNSLQEGEIDVGIIVVPSDRLQTFLPDRTPSLRDAIRYVEKEFKEAMTFPIVIIAIEHDGPGEALKKKSRKS